MQINDKISEGMFITLNGIHSATFIIQMMCSLVHWNLLSLANVKIYKNFASLIIETIGLITKTILNRKNSGLGCPYFEGLLQCSIGGQSSQGELQGLSEQLHYHMNPTTG